MSKVTYYGYFGPSQNVREAAIDAAGVNAFAAVIAALPRRAVHSADVVTLPIDRSDRRG